MAISKELQEIYEGANLSAVQIDTVEISHPNLSVSFFFCNYYENLKLGTEKGDHYFKASAFSFKIPPQKKEGLGQFTFTFALFDFKVIEELNAFINETTTPITLIYRVYASNVLNAPSSNLIYNIKVYDVTVENNTISLTGSMFSSLGEKIPKRKYTVDDFPGLRLIS